MCCWRCTQLLLAGLAALGIAKPRWAAQRRGPEHRLRSLCGDRSTRNRGALLGFVPLLGADCLFRGVQQPWPLLTWPRCHAGCYAGKGWGYYGCPYLGVLAINVLQDRQFRPFNKWAHDREAQR